MKISDYIVSYLKNQGIKYVFGLQGSGTAVQIFDSLEKTEGIDYVCTLHEQAAGMAADAYANVTENLGACITDSGPAATNLYTAVAGSYYNSNPVVYIVGQPPTGVLRKEQNLRHYGFHENNILDIFKPITKYVTQIINMESVRYELEKAVYTAKEGRPGPVVIAIPDDITWLDINPEIQQPFAIKQKQECWNDPTALKKCVEHMSKAKRPIILVGSGARCAHASDILMQINHILNWPVALTWGVRDMMPSDDPRNVGSFGVMGSRSGNFAVQNSDFILSVGARLDPSEIGGNPHTFARDAYIVSVDTDCYELQKYDLYGIPCQQQIHADAREFLEALSRFLQQEQWSNDYADKWVEHINKWKADYPLFLTHYDKKEIDPYLFVKCLSEALHENETVVTDVSTSRSYIFQAFQTKKNQRLVGWHNFSCLGYGLPAAIGTCFARPNSRVVSVMGDGALQFNIQELSTIAYNQLNLKIFVFANGGFGSIQRAQDKFLEGRHIASDVEHGLPIPDCSKIASAYGLPVFSIFHNEEIEKTVNTVLQLKGPAYCEVHLPISYWPTPCKNGQDPIEDMSPKLPREEFRQQMIVDPI